MAQDKIVVISLKSCETCGDGRGPFTTRGIQGKCYCKRTRNYEKPTHYCAAWREKNGQKRDVERT